MPGISSLIREINKKVKKSTNICGIGIHAVSTETGFEMGFEKTEKLRIMKPTSRNLHIRRYILIQINSIKY